MIFFFKGISKKIDRMDFQQLGKQCFASSAAERLRVFDELRSGGAGRTETPFPAVGLRLARQRGELFRLFRA